jgi:SAM-dependent methyltransferase
MALRKEQDRLPNLTVVNSDLNAIRFAPRQFDAIILNGVLEWVPLFDVTVAPGTAQVRLLSRLRETLRPGGWMYIGIENRFGWQQLAGAVDHSGLRYTSLLPRFLARQVCQRSGRYRSAFNVSYRTYTYSYLGYRRLFRRAGLRIAGTWFAPISYNLPTTLVPLQRAAIQHYTATRWLSPPWTWRKRLLNLIKRAVAREWCWRLAGGDFVFVLKESHE